MFGPADCPEQGNGLIQRGLALEPVHLQAVDTLDKLFNSHVHPPNAIVCVRM